MIGQLLLAKIAANPTETAWSQIYSTLNLYLVLEVHVEKDAPQAIAPLGKKLLERIQREYFALDEKTLESIKSAVSSSIEEIPTPFSCSIILVTLNNDICYIVIADLGSVMLKRDDQIGPIAQGKSGTVHGFSGKLENKDILILQTVSFSEKIPTETLMNSLQSGYITDAAESLAPLLHSNPAGNEAAIFIDYTKTHAAYPDETLLLEDYQTLDNPQEEVHAIEKEPTTVQPLIQEKRKRLPRIQLPQSLPNIRLLNKKIVFASVLVLLLLVLGVSLYADRQSSQKIVSQNRLDQFLPQTLKEIQEAEALVLVNKGVALTDFKNTKALLEKERTAYPDGSKEQAQIDTLITRINTQLDALSGNVPFKNKKEVFSIANVKGFSKIGSITSKRGVLVVVDSQKGSVHIGSSSIVSSIKNPVSVSADETYIYLLGSEEIARIEKNDETPLVGEIEDQSLTTIDTFNGNIYVLDITSNDILKKSEPDSAGSSYFKVKPTEKLAAFAIDGSVWVAYTNGQIDKFTKGLRDSIPFSEFPDKIGEDIQLYTEEGFANIYVLDRTNKKLLVIKKNGQYQNQYALDEFDTTVSIAIDEKKSIGYIATEKIVYSFDL